MDDYDDFQTMMYILEGDSLLRVSSADCSSVCMIYLCFEFWVWEKAVLPGYCKSQSKSQY